MARRNLPDLSRFELQCLRLLWDRGEASAKDIHAAIADPPCVSRRAMMRKEIEVAPCVLR